MSRAKASSNMVFHMEIDDVKFTPTIQEMKRQITLTRKEFDLQIRAAKDLGNEELALTKTIEKHNAVAKEEALMQKRIQEVLNRNKVVTEENMRMVSRATLEQKKAQETEQVAISQKEKATKQLIRLQSGVDGLSKSIKEMSDTDKLVTERLKAEGKETEAQEQHLKSLNNQRTESNKLIDQQKKLLDKIGKDSPDYSKEKMALESYKTDLAKLNKEEKQVAEQNAKLNKNLSTYKENISRVSGVTNAYVSRLEAEGKQYAANNAKLKGLVQEYSISKKMLSEQNAELGRLKDKYGETSKEYKTQEAEVNKLNSKLGEQAARYNKLAKSTGGYTSRLTSVSDTTAKISKKVGNVGDKFLSAGRATSLFGIGAVAALVKVNKNASDLQNTFIKTKNIIQTSGESAKESIAGVAAMQKDAKKYSLEYGESQNSIAKGYEELVKRGYSSKQSLGAMKNELEASKASGDEFSDVLKVTSQTMEAFGMTMDKNGRPLKSTKAMTDRTKDAVNKLAYAADATSANFSDMGVAMSYVGSTAHTAGFSLSETASALGVLSNNGLEADKAGTGLRKVINSLIDPTTNGAKALANLGLSTKDFVDQHGNMKSMSDIMKILNDHTKDLGKNEKGVLFKSLFGVTGMQAGEILANNADNLGKLNDRVKEATKNNYVHNLAKKNMDSFKTQFDRMKAALDNVGISLQKNVMPLLTSMVKWATNLLNKFAGMSPKIQKIVTVIAVLAAAFAPVTLAVGGILKSLQLVFSVVGKVNGLMGKAKVGGIEQQITALELERQKYAEILALKNEVDGNSGGKGAVNSSTPSVGSRVANNAANKTSMGQKVISAAAYAGTAINIGSSIWEAFSAQSKDKRNQAMWETGAKTLGAAVGGVFGGPIGAQIGSDLGGYISKHIKIKKVVENAKKSPKPKNPTTSQFVLGGMGGFQPTDTGKKIAKDAKKNAKAFKSEWSNAFKFIAGGSASSLKSYQNFANKINAQLSKSKNRELKNLKDLYKQGLISKKEYESKVNQINKKYSGKNSLGAQARKDTKEVVKARTDLNKKIKSINKTYAKLEKGQSKSKVKRLEKERKDAILKATKDGNKKIKSAENKLANDLSKISTKNSAKQKKIATQLKNSIGKISASKAAKLINESYKAEKAEIKSANNTYNKTVSAAKKKRDKTIAEANEEYSGNDKASTKMRNSIIDKANETYKKSKSAAEEKKKAATKNAKEEHNNVVEEAKKSSKDLSTKYDEETGKLKGTWSRIKDWFANNPVVLGIKQAASSLWDKVTGKKKGHALGGEIQKDHDALVGEEGPEYAYNKRTGKARILGEHGPEVTRVFAGEHILTAGQTRGLSKQHIKYLPSYANGTEDKYMFKPQPIAKLKQGKNMFVNERSKNKKGKQSQTVYLNVDKKSQRKFAKSLKDSANKVNKFEKDNKKALTKNDKDTAKLMHKTTKKIEDSYKDMSKNLTKQMGDLKKDLKSSWNGIYKDTKSEMTALYKYTKSEMDAIYSYTTKKESNLKKYISNTNNSIYKTWKKDWSDVSKAFNNEFAKLRNFARNGINGAIDSLNGGVGNINGLIGKFGGNSSILPKINHYATGTDGKIQQDEMALVNDALGSNYKEIVVLPSGKMIMPEERNAVMPLMKGSAVINGNQVANLKSTGRLQAHADGTMSDDAMEKMVSSKIKNPSAAWQQDFTDHVPTQGTGLEQSMTDTSKNDIKTDAVPWYQALWTTIQEQMDIGSGSRGAFLKYAIEHYMGKPYKMGGDGPTYYDCSGMVAAALSHFGIDIGRTTTAMQKTTDKISMSEAKPGDLTIWGHGDGAAGHVGIIMNRQGKMFNETPPRAGYGNISDVTSVPWDGAFRIRQLHDEDPDQPKVSAALKALTKKELGSKALSWISNKFNPTPSTGATGIGKQFDSSLIGEAAKAMHVNPSAGELATIKAVIQHESGGSSSVVNNWDSNAKAGHPSKGLLQFIQSTFNAYAMKGHTNILNAYDQLLAMFNDSSWRRDVHTGGWGPTGHRRYANGGFIDRHQLAEVGEFNKAEMVLPLTNKNRAYQLIDQAVRYMGDGDSYGSVKSNNTDSFELVDEIRNLRDDTNTLLKLLIKVVEEKPTGYNQYQIQKDIAQINSYKQMNTAIMRGK